MNSNNGQLNHYSFTLILGNVDENTESLEDHLFQAGCDDALINFRNGAVYLDFDREASSIEEAIISAVKNIESSSLGIKVIGIGPDNYVNESEMAKRLQVKRQLISLWVKGERRVKMPFPKPVMKLSERSPLWRWHEVLKWLYQQNQIDDLQMIETAKFIENINAVLLERDKEIRDYRHKILKKLL